MGFIRGSLIFFISLLIIISISAFLLAAGINSLLYPKIYLETFEKNNFFDYIANRTLGEVAPGANFLVIEDKRVETERLLSNFLSYLRGKTDEPNLTLKINTTMLREFFEERAVNFSICQNGEEPFDKEEIKCRPAEKNSSEFLDEVLERRNVTILEENTIDLSRLYDKNDNFSNLRKLVGYFRLVFYLLFIFSLLMIALIFLIKFFNYTGAMRIVGINIILGAVLVMFPIFAGSHFFGNYVAEYQKIPILAGLIKDLVFGVLKRVYSYGGFVIFTGCVLIVASVFFKIKSGMTKIIGKFRSEKTVLKKKEQNQI